MRKKVALLLVIGIVMVVGFMIVGQPVQGEAIKRFEAIPEKPNDFDAYTRDIWVGAYIDLCELEPDYWKQPGFYGSSWDIAKEKFYDNPDYSRWGVYGQGNLPREIGYRFSHLNKGDEFEVCTYFHNGFGVWTYQGFELVPWESEYFDIEITPNELTVAPTFPVFEDGWTQQIKIKLTAKQDIPEGGYGIGFDAFPPNGEYSRQKTREVLKMTIDKELYKEECYKMLGDVDRCDFLINHREKKYVDGGSYQSSVPLFKMGVTVG